VKPHQSEEILGFQFVENQLPKGGFHGQRTHLVGFGLSVSMS
jgi:hypothetical protein